MTYPIAIVLGILLVAMVFLVTEWIPMEVTALLVLGAVAVSGLVQPGEALAGFSNPAVVTVWAVFILSGGLTRTGVGNVVGRLVVKLSGSSEAWLVTVIMISAGGMSAVMNNVAVAALMLPVVMDIARQTRQPSSRLLLPLAYGSLLGGLTTQIGTPPNILVSEALRDNGLTPFTLFDFTPVGLTVMATGTLFMALVGRRLLPAHRAPEAGHGVDLREQYALADRMFRLRVPAGVALVGKSLAESRLGAVLGLNVVGITRRERTLLAPAPSEVLQAGDTLIVEGRLGRLERLQHELQHWSELNIEKDPVDLSRFFSDGMRVAEVALAADGPLAGKTLNETAFRSRFGVNVLALRRGAKRYRTHLQDRILSGGDRLLLHGPGEHLERLGAEAGLTAQNPISAAELQADYQIEDRLLGMRVPAESVLVGQSLGESRLGETLGVGVLAITRGDQTRWLPGSEEVLQAGDRLLVEGRLDDLFFLRSLCQLEVETAAGPGSKALESGEVGMVEAMLAPHSALFGKTLRQLHFREKYNLNVLAIWREGKAYRSDLGNIALRLGDALLLYGARRKLGILGREPDFLVLTEAAQEVPRIEKAPVALAVMGGVLLPVVMGWLPIYIAAVIGAACMVLTRCLTMEEAYRAIEWKGIFLIAGMMPLGVALDASGAARYLAEGVVAVAGPLGPLAVAGGLMGLTFLATCFIPTAALVVLMVPIVLTTAADLQASPHALMMVMALAASASFMTPISHPANVMVMGPGGYRFVDYLKVGLGLTLVVAATILLVLPVFWPLKP
ncbi:MAG: SLC13 family permease [Desulfobacteraceae bacterium]